MSIDRPKRVPPAYSLSRHEKMRTALGKRTIRIYENPDGILFVVYPHPDDDGRNGPRHRILRLQLTEDEGIEAIRQLILWARKTGAAERNKPA
jgi:hypothetical protein